MPLASAHPSPAFNPAAHGTAECRWNAALEAAPVLALPGGPIVIVSPHPDDEVFGAGGLIAKASRQGRGVTVVSVTDGEAAYPDWHGLNQIRRRELSDALHVLGSAPIAARQLRLPDGRVDEHRGQLSAALDRLVSPGTLLVAPYERDGHPDHDATAEVCCEISRLRGVALWRYPIWAWHHSTPERFADGIWGRFPLDAETRKTKAQAIACFASQLRPMGRTPIVPEHVLEYFRRPYEAFLV
jgi:LmbE family N-acetylglucosaminyl deacetylase